MNDTAAVLNDHTFQITNLTQRFERLAQAPEDEEDEEAGNSFLLWFEIIGLLATWNICHSDNENQDRKLDILKRPQKSMGHKMA